MDDQKTIVCYGELAPGKRYACDARKAVHQKRGAGRGKFGKRSAISYSTTCTLPAIIQVLFSDGTIANRCKYHLKSRS